MSFNARFVSQFVPALAGAAVAFGGISAANAVVQGVDSATFSPVPADTDGDGDFDNGYNVTSFTIGGVTFSTPSSVTSISNTDQSFYYYAENEADPGSNEAALTDGTRISTAGSFNLSFDGQYGRTLGINEPLVFVDNEFNLTEDFDPEPVTFQPLDSDGNQIGNFELSVEEADYGPELTGGRTDVIDIDGGSNHLTLLGVSFTLADFTEDTPSGAILAGNVTGISVDADGTDTAFLGSAIPEPTSLALLGLGGLALIGRRRRAA